MPRNENVYATGTETCLFCEIASGNHQAHIIWADEDHIAFLSRYPNTPGVTVVITKQHLSSYMAEVPDDALCNLVLAAKRVAQILGQALPDASRTGLAFEGFGIDHIHAKLFPFHGTTDEWRPIESEIDTFFPNYEGYFCTNDGPRADDEDLACVVAEITAAQTSS